jgi:hypothetical protein
VAQRTRTALEIPNECRWSAEASPQGSGATIGSVIPGSLVAKERVDTGGSVVAAAGVALERSSTNGRGVAPGGVGSECPETDARVVQAGVHLEQPMLRDVIWLPPQNCGHCAWASFGSANHAKAKTSGMRRNRSPTDERFIEFPMSEVLVFINGYLSFPR